MIIFKVGDKVIQSKHSYSNIWYDGFGKTFFVTEIVPVPERSQVSAGHSQWLRLKDSSGEYKGTKSGWWFEKELTQKEILEIFKKKGA